jgi:hypothetical protein
MAALGLVHWCSNVSDMSMATETGALPWREF